MKYETLRKSAFSHRFTAAASVLAVLLLAGAAGVVTASPTDPQDRYRLDYSMNRTEAGLLEVRTRVVDTRTGEIVGEPSVTATPGEQAVMQLARAGKEWTVFVKAQPDASGTLTLQVREDGRTLQDTTMTFPSPGQAPERKYTGQPISLQLARADLRDVIGKFGAITGLTIDIAPDVQGTVTVDFKDVPWDEAFDILLRQNGLSWRLQGDKMEVFRQ
jgi:hypothetical protein